MSAVVRRSELMFFFVVILLSKRFFAFSFRALTKDDGKVALIQRLVTSANCAFNQIGDSAVKLTVVGN